MRFSRFLWMQIFGATQNHCGSGGATIRLARDGGLSVNSDVECKDAIAGKPAPTGGFMSILREAFQADERAGSEQITQATAISQTQIRRRQFGQWIENESAFLHMVVRHLEARFIDCLLYTSPSPRDGLLSRMPSSA